jgi:hypothetical protein
MGSDQLFARLMARLDLVSSSLERTARFSRGRGGPPENFSQSTGGPPHIFRLGSVRTDRASAGRYHAIRGPCKCD